MRVSRAFPATYPVDLVVSAVLLGLGTATFGPVFDGRPGYVAAGGGALLGGLVGVIAARFRLGALTTTAILLVTYVVFGGALALPDTTVGHVVPTADTVHRLTLLTVQAWRDLLTVSTPANEFTGPAVVPFLSGLVCAVLTTSIMLRGRWAAWALLPATVFLTVGILWGVAHAPHAPIYGTTFAVVGLGWAALRTERRRSEASARLLGAEAPRAVLAPRRAAAALTLLVLAGAVATVAAPNVAAGTRRNVLRDHVVPPLDLRAYATPLAMYRYLERDQKDQVVMTVSGLPANGRIRLATMDTYDGIVYGVGDDSAAFRQVGRDIAGRDAAGEEQAHLDVTVGAYSGNWIPGGGDLHQLSLAGDGPYRGSVYYNNATGTALSTRPMTPGISYTASVGLPMTPSGARMATAALAGGPNPQVTNIPDVLAQVATDLAGDAKGSYAQLKAIAQTLHTQGYYSDGSDGLSPPGHTAARLTSMFQRTQYVGDDEQYATGMALMATKLGMPSRVVMGFYPSANQTASGGTVKITGADAHVWVEVDFRGVGWVAFDPTPSRDRHATAQVPQPQSKPRPQVLPPPQVLKPPTVPDPIVQNGRKPKPQVQHHASNSNVLLILLVAGAALGGTAVLALPFVLVLLLKRRRWRRRRASDRAVDSASGSWAEVVDAAVDLGVVLPRTATRQESARDLEQSFPSTSVLAVAERIDAGVFGAREPSAADLDSLWDEVSTLTGRMRQSVSPLRRVWAAVSPRSLNPTRRVRKQ